jgi:hypothetical protein
MNDYFPVVFSGSALHPLTADYVRRVQAQGGTISTAEVRAEDYRIRAMLGLGLDPAALVAYPLWGDLNAALVPSLNRGGLTGNATNTGFVAGDLSVAGGLVQTGTKRFETPLTTAQISLIGWSAAAYHSGDTSAQRILHGGAELSTPNIVSLQYRGSENTIRARHEAGAALPVSGGSPVTSGRVMHSSASNTDLRLYLNGAQIGTTQAGLRAAIGGAVTVFLGGSNSNGLFVSGALATLCGHIFGCGFGVTPDQAAAVDAIMRETLIRGGRNPCD